MNEMTDGHTVTSFDDEMKLLHDHVMEIGDLVRNQLCRAVKSLEEEDVDEARAVIDRDQEVNELDIKIDDEVIHLIAKRQPLAKDLREILTVNKIVTDLERVGDEARKIAMLCIHFYDHNTTSPSEVIVRDMVKMSEFIDEMLEKAICAYDELDIDLALDAIRMDIELEIEFRSCLRRLSTFIMEDSRVVGHVVETVLGLRALERIGGHAKNIGG
ncbi:MAG: phosphate signaling complex protein PhoU, partial [Gammaproteobacteria bacterium]|nr:phosphate signaling complex protein PhoU [Gammaproteobacteria bacterium]